MDSKFALIFGLLAFWGLLYLIQRYIEVRLFLFNIEMHNACTLLVFSQVDRRKS